MVNTLSQQLVSAVLVGSVVLGGLHGKELAKLSADTGDIKTHTADAQFKINGELHNHIDKQSLHSLLKVSSTDNGSHQVDGRGLRLLHSHRLITPHKLKDKLFGERMLGLMLITARV